MRIPLQYCAILLFCTSTVYGVPSTERFSIGLGGFIADQNTDTRLDTSLGNGTDIDLENDLSLDSSGTFFRADGYYRFNRKHRLDFSVYDLSRDGNTQINKQIQFGDQTFNINTQVSSELDLLILKGGYTYTFLQRDRGNLGVSLGLYTADTKIKLSGPSQGNVESRSITTILPVIGLRGEYEIAPKWTLRGSGQLFKFEIDNIDGSFSDLYAGVDYKLTDRFALGLGYNKVLFDVESSKSDFTGKLDWDYDGIMLFFKSDFGKIN